MAALSNTYEDALLNWIRGTSFPAAPATVYAALFDGSPGDDGAGGTEITNTIKGSTTRNAMAFNAPSGGEIENSAEVVITASASAPATASHWGLFTASTGGTLIVHSELSATKNIQAGDEVKFGAGDVTISVD
jgi:hypothetical protein